MDKEMTTNEEIEQEAPPETPQYAAPRGAMAFVFLMLTAYVIYFFVTWFEIFVLRGA